MNAMDIKPRPKLIITIFKSMAHCGATAYSDSTVDQDDLFSFHLYVAEKDSHDYAQTDRQMATFLKVGQKCSVVALQLGLELSLSALLALRNIYCPCASRPTHSFSCMTVHVQCPRYLVKFAALSARNETEFFRSQYWRLLVRIPLHAGRKMMTSRVHAASDAQVDAGECPLQVISFLRKFDTFSALSMLYYLALS